MEKSLERYIRLKRPGKLGVGYKTAEYFFDTIKRVIKPPSKEIQHQASFYLHRALQELGESIQTPKESRAMGREIEDIISFYQEDIPDDFGKMLLMNVHFWLQAIREPSMKKYGTEVKYRDFLADDVAIQEYEDNGEVNHLIENRIDNLDEIEENFLAWVDKNDVRERLKDGSLILSTNHDTWSTQPISLYLFQKFLGISPEKCATVLGPRLLTFKKFMFDPERLMKGLGKIFLTIPPTDNGRHEAFDKELLKKSGMKYVRGISNFLKNPGSIASIAFGASRDKRNKETDELIPVQPSDEALIMADTLLNRRKASIVPIGFRHEDKFKLERSNQKIHLDINFGDMINPGDAPGETELERGQWIHEQMVDVVPQKTVDLSLPQHSESISQ